MLVSAHRRASTRPVLMRWLGPTCFFDTVRTGDTGPIRSMALVVAIVRPDQTAFWIERQNLRRLGGAAQVVGVRSVTICWPTRGGLRHFAWTLCVLALDAPVQV